MTDPNLALLEEAARLLEPVLAELEFVGGCATGLLVTDTAAPDVRPTHDVDRSSVTKCAWPTPISGRTSLHT